MKMEVNAACQAHVIAARSMFIVVPSVAESEPRERRYSYSVRCEMEFNQSQDLTRRVSNLFKNDNALSCGFEPLLVWATDRLVAELERCRLHNRQTGRMSVLLDLRK